MTQQETAALRDFTLVYFCFGSKADITPPSFRLCPLYPPKADIERHD